MIYDIQPIDTVDGPANPNHQFIDGKHPIILLGFQPSKIGGLLGFHNGPSTVCPPIAIPNHTLPGAALFAPLSLSPSKVLAGFLRPGAMLPTSSSLVNC